MSIPKNRYCISAIIIISFSIAFTLSSCNTTSTIVPIAPAASPLDPPAAGTGFQVTSGKFDVAPNFEREIFIYRDLCNTDPIYINRIHSKLLPNSHHMVMYLFDPSTPSTDLPGFNVMRDLRNPDGTYNFSTENQMQWHVFLGGSMIDEDDYNFPLGVALPLPAHRCVCSWSHYWGIATAIRIAQRAKRGKFKRSIAPLKHNPARTHARTSRWRPRCRVPDVRVPPSGAR